MAEKQPSTQGTDQTQKLKAQALIVAVLAMIASSYVVLGCLLPVIALLVIGIWFAYGGTAAFLSVVIPSALVLVLVSLVFRRSR